MTCEWVRLPNGNVAIVCNSVRRKRHACCGPRCNKSATVQCDWITGKKPDGRKITCDAWVCATHALHIGDNKDLCPEHAALWATHPANPANARQKKLDI